MVLVILSRLLLTLNQTNNKSYSYTLPEYMVDYFAFDNEYGSTDQLWQNYFLAFNHLA